jgi:NitT/TauT family transport system ATP-binding protein
VTIGQRTEGAHLALDGVGKRFQARDRVVNALEATSLVISGGEFVTLVGPSGCGKSTLLNIISGLTPASEGSVLLDGNAIVGVNRRVGYITQQDNLFPWRLAA